MADTPARTSAPTIYDVARVAGVAPSTVSRALARPGRVNADTAARIRKVAEELGYRVNPIASALVTQRTRIVAVMVSDIANPFYSELIRGAEAAASEAGYVIVLADARESGMFEREALERVIPAAEGILIGSSRMPDSALRMIAKQRPMVVLNREMPDIPSVITDNQRGMTMALQHLADLGHQQVTYVAGPESSWTDGARWRALHDRACEIGISCQRLGPYTPTFEGGMAAGQLFLQQPTSAVIAYNDLLAIGVVHSLRRAGLQSPRDVSVIGFDDILPARLVTPALTTVAAPLRHMGETGVRNLLAVLGGAQHRNPRAFVLPVRLLVRGSTGQRSRKRISPALGTTKVSGSAS